MNLNDIRTEYEREDLNIDDLNHSPSIQLETWIKDASKLNKYFNAATLSTIDSEKMPASRIILVKNIEKDSLIFFTNYNSDKGKQMAYNPNVSLLFFWPEQDRQIRLQGSVTKISRKESEVYFSSRPKDSQISAMASNQSSITSKEDLYSKFNKIKDQQTSLHCPESWGGYKVEISKYEFWQGRPNRLHDRFIYTLATDSSWKIDRLCP